jgi:hypothetical protein
MGLLQHLVHDHIFSLDIVIVIIKFTASAFPYAYSWVLDPSIVSHSVFPKTPQMVNTRNNCNGQGSNANNEANSQIEQLIANQNQLM